MNSIYDWSIRFILAFQQIGEWLLAPNAGLLLYRHRAILPALHASPVLVR